MNTVSMHIVAIDTAIANAIIWHSVMIAETTDISCERYQTITLEQTNSMEAVINPEMITLSG